jgi:inosine/xanthosine triphosphatase
MIVHVGSSNAMKVAAARVAFARFFKRVKVTGVEVPSGVQPQPLSFGEVARGARNRARGAFQEDCDYAVGIEAGVFRLAAVSPRPFQVTLACVFDGEREALGAGPFFELPERLLREIVKNDKGSVSLVTKGKVTRRDVTRDAVMMALAPFVTPKLYEQAPAPPEAPVVEFQVLEEGGLDELRPS